METSKPSPPALMMGLARPLPSFRLRTGSLNTLRLRRIFDLFDSDGDGELTATELCDALDRLGLGADPAELGPIVAAHARAGHPDSLAFDDFRALHGALAEALLGSDSAAEEEEADIGRGHRRSITSGQIRNRCDRIWQIQRWVWKDSGPPPLLL